MKSYQSLLNETREAESIEELESAADLFNYGIERGYYSLRQSKEFNAVYWEIKDQLTAQNIRKSFKGINYNELLYMVSKAPLSIKENNESLINYIRGIIGKLKKSKVVA